MFKLPVTLQSYSELQLLVNRVYDCCQEEEGAAEALTRLSHFMRPLSAAEVQVAAIASPEVLEAAVDTQMELVHFIPKSVRDAQKEDAEEMLGPKGKQDNEVLWQHLEDDSVMADYFLYTLPPPLEERRVCEWLVCWAYGTLPADHGQWPVQCGVGKDTPLHAYLGSLCARVLGVCGGTLINTKPCDVYEKMAKDWQLEEGAEEALYWATGACCFRLCWAAALYKRWVWDSLIVCDGSKFGWMHAQAAIPILGDILVPLGKPAPYRLMWKNVELGISILSLSNMWSAAVKATDTIPNMEDVGSVVRYHLAGQETCGEAWNSISSQCLCIHYMRYMEARFPATFTPFFPHATKSPHWIVNHFLPTCMRSGNIPPLTSASDEAKADAASASWVHVLGELWDATPPTMWREQFYSRVLQQNGKTDDVTKDYENGAKALISMNSTYMCTQWAGLLVNLVRAQTQWYTRVGPVTGDGSAGLSTYNRIATIILEAGLVLQKMDKKAAAASKSRKSPKKKGKTWKPMHKALRLKIDAVKAACENAQKHMEVTMPWIKQMYVPSWVARFYVSEGKMMGKEDLRQMALEMLPLPSEMIPYLWRAMTACILLWMRSLFTGNYVMCILLWRAMGNMVMHMQNILRTTHAMCVAAHLAGVPLSVLDGEKNAEGVITMDWLNWTHTVVAKVGVLLAGWVLKGKAMAGIYTPLQVLACLDIATPERVRDLLKGVAVDFSKITSIVTSMTMMKGNHTERERFGEIMEFCAKSCRNHDVLEDHGGVDACTWLYEDGGANYWQVVDWVQPVDLITNRPGGSMDEPEVEDLVTDVCDVMDRMLWTKDSIGHIIAPVRPGVLHDALSNAVPINAISSIDVQRALWVSVACYIESMFPWKDKDDKHPSPSPTSSRLYACTHDVLKIFCSLLPSIIFPRNVAQRDKADELLGKTGPGGVMAWLEDVHPGVLIFKQHLHGLRHVASQTVAMMNVVEYTKLRIKNKAKAAATHTEEDGKVGEEEEGEGEEEVAKGYNWQKQVWIPDKTHGAVQITKEEESMLLADLIHGLAATEA